LLVQLRKNVQVELTEWVAQGQQPGAPWCLHPPPVKKVLPAMRGTLRKTNTNKTCKARARYRRFRISKLPAEFAQRLRRQHRVLPWDSQCFSWGMRPCWHRSADCSCSAPLPCTTSSLLLCAGKPG
jgi:hypothetical protein